VRSALAEGRDNRLPPPESANLHAGRELQISVKEATKYHGSFLRAVRPFVESRSPSAINYTALRIRRGRSTWKEKPPFLSLFVLFSSCGLAGNRQGSTRVSSRGDLSSVSGRPRLSRRVAVLLSSRTRRAESKTASSAITSDSVFYLATISPPPPSSMLDRTVISPISPSSLPPECRMIYAKCANSLYGDLGRGAGSWNLTRESTVALAAPFDNTSPALHCSDNTRSVLSNDVGLR